MKEVFQKNTLDLMFLIPVVRLKSHDCRKNQDDKGFGRLFLYNLPFHQFDVKIKIS